MCPMGIMWIDTGGQERDPMSTDILVVRDVDEKYLFKKRFMKILCFVLREKIRARAEYCELSVEKDAPF